MLINLNKLKKSRKHKGAIAIEFALVMTFILVPLFLGTVELGRLLYQYNALTKSVRDSAKYLSTVANTVPDYDSKYKKESVCLAIYGNIDCKGDVLVSGLTTNNISFDPPKDDSGMPITVPGIKIVTVSVINYKATLITSLFKPFNFNNISVSMRQQES